MFEFSMADIQVAIRLISFLALSFIFIGFICLIILGATYGIRRSLRKSWDNFTSVYHMESLRYYMDILLEHGRTGILKEVNEAKQENSKRYCYSNIANLKGFTISSSAALDVFNERARQVIALGYSPESDDKYTNLELKYAAKCYLETDGSEWDAKFIPELWPWSRESWAPFDVRHNLVRSAALIIAEIERIDRAEAKKQPDSEIKQ